MPPPTAATEPAEPAIPSAPTASTALPGPSAVPPTRPPDPELAVHATGLTKRFGATTAVDGLDLAVPAGSVYGFLGPNGAGKTTTVRMLATLLRPDAGRALVLGHDVAGQAGAVRRRIALTGQFAALDDDLTGRENLTLGARLLGLRPAPARARAADLLAAFELEAAADRQVKTYSGGMRRRLDIAASLIARPELLFLDEPTTGLDPAARNQVWDIVRALSATGATVLLTTQYLAEAEALATRVAVIDHGRLLAEGTPGELRAAGGTGTLHIRLADPDTRGRAAELLPDAVADGADPTALTVTATTSAQAAESLTRLTRDGVPVAGFSLDQPSLEEVFLALTAAPAPNGAPATSQKGS